MKIREKLLQRKSKLRFLIKEDQDLNSCKRVDEFIHQQLVKNGSLDPKKISDFRPGYRAWLFLSNTFNFAISGIHTNSKGEICNNITLFPCKSWDGQNEILSAQIADTFTDKSYLGLGLFDEAILGAINQISKRQHHLIYGFPNPFSLPGYIKRMNFQRIEQGIVTQIRATSLTRILMRIIPNASAGIVKIFKKVDPLRKLVWLESALAKKNRAINFQYCDVIDDDFYKLWESLSKNINFLNVRNAEFMNWRYLLSDQEFKIYKLKNEAVFLGYIVTLEKTDALNIRNLWLVDWLYDQKNKQLCENEIIKFLKKHSVQCKADNIIIQQSENSPLGISCNFKTVGEARPLVIHQNDAGKKYLNKLNPWHFTLGDTDHF